MNGQSSIWRHIYFPPSCKTPFLYHHNKRVTVRWANQLYIQAWNKKLMKRINGISPIVVCCVSIRRLIARRTEIGGRQRLLRLPSLVNVLLLPGGTATDPTRCLCRSPTNSIRYRGHKYLSGKLTLFAVGGR